MASSSLAPPPTPSEARQLLQTLTTTTSPSTGAPDLPALLAKFQRLAPLSGLDQDQLLECFIDALPEPLQDEVDRLTPDMHPRRTLQHVVLAVLDPEEYASRLDTVSQEAHEETAFAHLTELARRAGEVPVAEVVAGFERWRYAVAQPLGEWGLKHLFREALPRRCKTELMLKPYDSGSPLGAFDFFALASLDELLAWAKREAAARGEDEL